MGVHSNNDDNHHNIMCASAGRQRRDVVENSLYIFVVERTRLIPTTIIIHIMIFECSDGAQYQRGAVAAKEFEKRKNNNKSYFYFMVPPPTEHGRI